MQAHAKHTSSVVIGSQATAILGGGSGGWAVAALLSLFVAACSGGGGTGGTGADGGGGSGASGGSGGGSTCGGIAGVTCDESAYCDFPDDAMCGNADQTGTCKPRPGGCQEDCPGVCGCDGQFYCNTCIAAQAGIDVDPNASCAPPGGECGGLAGAACNDDEYCDYADDAMCGAADQTGTCKPRPEGCTADCPGVCGCDGQFYCNACTAAAAGIDVDPDGSCAPPGGECGGLLGAPCEEGEYCDFADDAMCGAADQTGICQPRPEVCTKDCPGVCGCDGQFYCNACLAAVAGVDVSPDVSCKDPQPGDVCGGFAGLPCAADEYCDFPEDAMCGAADQTGTCQPRPEACPLDCPGVCGCDGQFYCNACIAAAAGIDVNRAITCAP